MEQDIVDRALREIHEDLEGALGAWPTHARQGAFLGSIASGSTYYEGFADCDLVLEAVVEELPIKQRVFAELREIVSAGCVLATNTSSLSVAAMGADLGMHFFNPVALMPLIELVRTTGHDRRSPGHRFEVAKAPASARSSWKMRPPSSSTASSPGCRPSCSTRWSTGTRSRRRTRRS